MNQSTTSKLTPLGSGFAGSTTQIEAELLETLAAHGIENVPPGTDSGTPREPGSGSDEDEAAAEFLVPTPAKISQAFEAAKNMSMGKALDFAGACYSLHDPQLHHRRPITVIAICMLKVLPSCCCCRKVMWLDEPSPK